MGNLRNDYTYGRHDLRLSGHKYYDLYLSDDYIYLPPVISFLSGDSLVAYFDFNNPNIYSTGTTSGNTIYSLATWINAVNSGNTLHDIGLTGIDNGLIIFDSLSGDTGNTQLLSAMTLSNLSLVTGDTRLTLNRVTGNTGSYIYPVDILSGTVGNYAQFCGGFYQGYYKLDGFDYDVLPNRVNKGWVSEFWLNKNENCNLYSGETLNDKYPDNKGFFFYLGTRAENKFWSTFNGLNTGCTSGCTSGTCESGETVTSGCTIPKETNSVTSTGIPINPSSYHVTEVYNQFLIYSRAQSGFTACGIEQGSGISITGMTYPNMDEPNQFLIYSRAKSGQTACSYKERDISITQTNRDGDIIDNALGFRIKDDGSIGYRLITYTCTGDTSGTGPVGSAVTITEEYSQSGLVSNDIWTHVAVRFIADITMNDCQLEYYPRRPGKLMFYINSKLKFVVNNFDEFIAKRLIDDMTKQEGVPFNISVGGGTQGLIESLTFDGPDPDDDNLLIEKYFGGSFIGGISKFRFYNDGLCYCSIQDNYNIEKDLYL
jgi:hypothetical protein